MNNNDLMDAMSGIDPKYIDEAAFELHGTPIRKKAKTVDFRRTVFIVLPAVAVLLLTFSVTLPMVMRTNKSESASMPASDSAAYEAAGAAEEAAPAYDSEAPAAAEEAMPAEEPAAAEEAMPAEEPAAAEEAMPAYEAEEAEATADEAPVQESKAAKSGLAGVVALGLEKATFSEGIITLEIKGSLPQDTASIVYSITGTDDNGSETTYAEGSLDDVLKSRDPLTLDISHLELHPGTYTLSIGDETIEFEVNGDGSP